MMTRKSREMHRPMMTRRSSGFLRYDLSSATTMMRMHTKTLRSHRGAWKLSEGITGTSAAKSLCRSVLRLL